MHAIRLDIISSCLEMYQYLLDSSHLPHSSLPLGQVHFKTNIIDFTILH